MSYTLIEDFLKFLGLSGEVFDEKTDSFQLRNGLKVEKYKTPPDGGVLGSINHDENIVKIPDGEWFESEVLAHELAHHERFKNGGIVSMVSGYGISIMITLLISVVSIGAIAYFLGIGGVGTPLSGSALVGFVIIIGIMAFEERKANELKSEIKKKYGLEVNCSEPN